MCSACRTSVNVGTDKNLHTDNNDIFVIESTSAPPVPVSATSGAQSCWVCGQGCTTYYHISNKGSSKDTGLENEINYNFPYEFKWIEDLGFMIINKVQVYANSIKLQEYSGQYLSNMIRRDFKEEQQKLINRMIGNTPDINDPANYANRNGNLIWLITSCMVGWIVISQTVNSVMKRKRMK